MFLKNLYGCPNSLLGVVQWYGVTIPRFMYATDKLESMKMTTNVLGQGN